MNDPFIILFVFYESFKIPDRYLFLHSSHGLLGSPQSIISHDKLVV